jgi:hypothetical protein
VFIPIGELHVGLAWDIRVILLQANQTEDLVEVDWPLVLVSTEPSKDNSSIYSAIEDMFYSRSL